MTLSVKCACGKILTSSEKLAGRTIDCPYCGDRLRMPGKTRLAPKAKSADAAPQSGALVWTVLGGAVAVILLVIGWAFTRPTNATPAAIAETSPRKDAPPSPPLPPTPAKESSPSPIVLAKAEHEKKSPPPDDGLLKLLTEKGRAAPDTAAKEKPAKEPTPKEPIAKAPSPFEIKYPDEKDPLLGEPSEICKQAAEALAKFLPKGHITLHPFDAEISRRWSTLFMDAFDPGKMYFLRSDIEEFRKDENAHADRFRKGEFDGAYAIFRRFRDRLRETTSTVSELLAKGFDERSSEIMPPRRDDEPWPVDAAERRTRLARHLHHGYLEARAEGSTAPEALSRLVRRQQAFVTRIARYDDDALLIHALKTLTRSYDPYSTYYAPHEWRTALENARGEGEGIGISIGDRDGDLVVGAIIPGGPVAREGSIRAGDRIVGVDPANVGDMRDMRGAMVSDLLRLIKGARGSALRVEVLRPGESASIVVELKRDKILAPAVRGTVLNLPATAAQRTCKVGYLIVPGFYGEFQNTKSEKSRSCSEDARAFLKNLSADVLVVDMRDAGAGTGESRVLTNLFFASGTLDWQQLALSKPYALTAAPRKQVWAGPMVVLVSESSRTWAELAAAAYQANGRALIVGEHTRGGGTAQTLYDLDTFGPTTATPRIGVVNVTIVRYFSPAGRSLQGHGVVPDIVLPWHAAPTDRETDMPFALPAQDLPLAKPPRLPLGLDDATIAELRDSSERRRLGSNDFARIGKSREAVAAMSKTGIPLNLDAVRARTVAIQEDTARVLRWQSDVEPNRDYYMEEVLAIAHDYWRSLPERNKKANVP